MRILTWTLAACFFLGVAATTALLVTREPASEAGSGAGLAGTGTTESRIEPEASLARDRLHSAFDAASTFLEKKMAEAAERTRSAASGDQILLAQGAKGSSPREVGARLALLREHLQLDILLVATANKDVFGPESPATPVEEAPPAPGGLGAGPEASRGSDPAKDLANLERAGIFVALEPFLRAGKETAAFAAMPRASEARGSAHPGGSDASIDAVLLASVPLVVPEGYPSAVLVGGYSMGSLSRWFEADPAGVGHQLQAFSELKLEAPTVIAGRDLGAVVRPELVEALARDSIVDATTFVGPSPRAGRWTLIRGLDGEALGAWGVTSDAPPPAVAGIAAAGSPGRSTGAVDPARDTLAYLAERFPYFLGATLAAGVLWLALLFASTRRSGGRRPAGMVVTVQEHRTTPASPPVPVIPEGSDLLSQFEINWKTFASYTQDLLHQKLKELEEAPQRGVDDVREQVARLSDALFEVKRDLAQARNEDLSATRGVLEKVTTFLEGESQSRPDISEETKEVLEKIEGDFDQARDRFAQLHDTVTRLGEVFGERQDAAIAQRVAEEVAKLESQWNERVTAFTGEIEAARRERESVLAELERARGTEASLRAEIAEGLERERGLAREIEEERGRVAQANAERETAWKRERQVIEELHESGRRIKEIEGRVGALEEEKRRLETRVRELEGREAELLANLDAAHETEEKYKEAIKEVYREEGRVQKDLERRQREFEADRDRLAAALAATEARQGGIEASAATAASDRDRWRTEAEARRRELEAVERALEASKAERAHFEEETRRLAGELEALEAQRTSLDVAQLEAIEREVAAAVAQLEETRATLEKEREERRRLESELRAREASLAETSESLARGAGEAQALRRELEAARAEAARLDADRLRREVEEGPAKEALEKALQASLSDLERYRQEDEGRERELRDAKEALERALATTRADNERLEEARRTEEKRWRGSEEERLRLRARLAELEAQWQSKQGGVDVRIAEVERRAAEAERRLADAERRRSEAEKGMEASRAESTAARAAAQASADNQARLRALEREKQDSRTAQDELGKKLSVLEKELEALRSFQSVLVEGRVPAAILAVDSSSKLFAWNPAAEALWGREARSVLGSRLADLPAAAIGEPLVAAVQTARETRRPVNLERVSFQGQDGRPRHARGSAEPVLDPSGDLLGVILSVEDVTLEVENEIDARCHSIFSASLARSLPGALVILDVQNRVISWNGAAERVFGVAERNALGNDFFSLKTPLSREAFKKYFEEKKKDRAPHRIRVRFDSKGTPAIFQVTESPFLDESGAARGTLLLVEEAVESALLAR